MPRYAVPITTTHVFTLATTADYDLVMAWLNAADAATKLQHGIASVSGVRNQRRITITVPSMMSDIDTDKPILPVLAGELIG